MLDKKAALYRRNNFGQPCIWYAYADGDHYVVMHGIIGKTIRIEQYKPSHSRGAKAEVKSKFESKRKAGYKYIHELKDDCNLPVEEEIYSFVAAYLPEHRTGVDGRLLPMLAKSYDNTNNAVFRNGAEYYGQWKINGLRCFVSAERNDGDLFNPVHLIFQSREGAIWKGLVSLEEYLLRIIPKNVLEVMLEEHYILDGEIYLPNHTVNEINHFVKDPTCKEHNLLQYWCYDVAMEDEIQGNRLEFLQSNFNSHVIDFKNKDEHLNNTNRFVVLPITYVRTDIRATNCRNSFINLGFEGLILRNINLEYQFGKRNRAMIKYKNSTDGKFKIVDIYPEGNKRENIPLLLLKNDINDELFETHLNGSFEYQAAVLEDKAAYIGRYAFVEFGERSGIKNVPFHVKTVKILND